jgi:DNA-binding NarL/FixJ family response regulator
VIGAGIETVLRIEDLYDLRRVGSLGDGIEAAQSWPADAALVDGVLVEGTPGSLGVPCVVLSGDAESGQRLAGQLPGAKGWLPKDASPAKLVGAIDDALGIVRVGGSARSTAGLVVAVLIFLLFVGALALFVWRFFLS